MIKKLFEKIRRASQRNPNGRNVSDVPVESIVPNPYQPRRHYDEKALKGLAQSIKTHGLLQPVILRKTANLYEIVSGERRVRAFKLLGYRAIPAIVGKFSDGEMLEAGLLENLQRKDLTPMEEAMGFSSLSRLFNPMTQDEFTRFVGARMGTDAEDVYSKLMLLTFPPVVREALHREWITEEQAQLLKGIPSEEGQLEVLAEIKNNKISCDELTKLVRKHKQEDVSIANVHVRDEAVILTLQLLHNVLKALEEMDIEAAMEEGMDENGNMTVKLVFQQTPEYIRVEDRAKGIAG